MTTVPTLTTALESAFDEYSIEHRVRVGERNTVYSAAVDGRRAACKLTDCQPDVLAREARVQRAVARSTPVRCPAVYAAGDGYLVQEWLDGDAFGDVTRREPEQFRTVGATLARLHAAAADWFDGHGTLRLDDDGLAVEDPTDWPTRFTEFVESWAADLDGTPDADVGREVVEAVTAHRDSFRDTPPVLVHGEASPDHVLLERADRVALIDWELAQAAPGEFDLVWAERDLLARPLDDDAHADRRRALHEGYADERPLGEGFDRRRDLYRAGFAMRELGLWHDPAQSVKRRRENHRERLRSFVFGRLDAVR